jgi:RHS repeat-associated protein
LTDHLGSTSITANGTTGALVSEMRYKPWGETRWSSGTTPTSKHFTGQIEDAGIGLYFYGSRFYDPAVGRFTQADTVVPGAGNPQKFNRYAYANNSPVKYTDPTGHSADCGIGMGCVSPYSPPPPSAPLPSSTDASDSSIPTALDCLEACWLSNNPLYSGTLYRSLALGSPALSEPDYYSDNPNEDGPATWIDVLGRILNPFASAESRKNAQAQPSNLELWLQYTRYEGGLRIQEITIANKTEHTVGVTGISVNNVVEHQAYDRADMVYRHSVLTVSLNQEPIVLYSNYLSAEVRVEMRSWTHSITPSSFKVIFTLPGMPAQ